MTRTRIHQDTNEEYEYPDADEFPEEEVERLGQLEVEEDGEESERLGG